MNFDFEKALIYISKDSQWGNKLLAGGGLVLSTFAVFVFPLLATLSGSLLVVLLTFIPAIIFSVLIWLIISGYVCETAYRRIQNREDYTLPDWTKFGELIVLGFKYFLGYILYFVPLIVFGLIFMGLFLLIGNPFTGFHHISGFSYGILVFACAVVLFLYILTLIFLPLMMSAFFADKKILSFVSYKKAANLIRGNVSNYVTLIVLFIALSILTSIITSILCVTVVGYILFPLIYMYIYFVISELCAQFVVSAKTEQTDENTPSSC